MEELKQKYSEFSNWLNEFCENKELSDYNELEIHFEDIKSELKIYFICIKTNSNEEVVFDTSIEIDSKEDIVSEIVNLMKSVITEDVLKFLINIYVYKVYNNKSLIFIDKIRNVDKED